MSSLEGWKPGGVWTTKLESCPCCKRWVQVEFKGQRLIGVKHATFENDQACPYVAQQDANPMNRFQRVVFNYAGLEDSMYAAKEAVRRDEIRDARLDGRPDPNEVSDDTGLVPDPDDVGLDVEALSAEDLF
jgi:hypothetical protein